MHICNLFMNRLLDEHVCEQIIQNWDKSNFCEISYHCAHYFQEKKKKENKYFLDC